MQLNYSLVGKKLGRHHPHRGRHIPLRETSFFKIGLEKLTGFSFIHLKNEDQREWNTNCNKKWTISPLPWSARRWKPVYPREILGEHLTELHGSFPTPTFSVHCSRNQLKSGHPHDLSSVEGWLRRHRKVDCPSPISEPDGREGS